MPPSNRSRPSPTPDHADSWTRRELAVLDRLASPARIQAFLDTLTYSADPFYRSPRSVIRDRRAHCFDGAVFAACAFARLGERPLLVDLRAVRDDDHVLAVFRHRGHLGAVSKSNFAGLRFREPVFRTVRELVLSYFEDYYNLAREKTLRGYTTAIDLGRFDRLGWPVRDAAMSVIAKHLDRARHHPVVPPGTLGSLSPVDPRRYRAGLLGANRAGLYRPG